MPEEIKDQLLEVKADGEDSETSDPVTPAGGMPKKRRADVKKTVDGKADDIEDDVKTPQNTSGGTKKAPPRKADKAKVKESIEEMFDGQDLSEEFKNKAGVVFEAALTSAINEELTALEEEFEEKLTEQTALAVDELVEKVDTYLDYVVETWMEENQVAIDRGIKVEMAESFMSGLMELFSSHNIEVAEDKVDVVADLSDKLEETEEKLNESLNEIIELRKKVVTTERREALDDLCEGLTETSAEKLRALVKDVDADTIDSYKEKVKIIRENYFKDSKVITEDTDVVDSIETEDNEVERKVDPEVLSIVKSISQSIRK